MRNFKLHRAMLAASAVIGLAACSPSDSTRNGAETASQQDGREAAGRADRADARRGGRQAEGRLVPLSELRDVEVAGLRLGMARDEVLQILFDAGYEDPNGAYSFNYQKDVWNDHLIPEGVYGELQGHTETPVPGMFQGLGFRRSRDGMTDSIGVGFVVNLSGDAELYRFEFRRRFDDRIPSAAMISYAEDMASRFGPATRGSGSENLANAGRIDAYFQWRPAPVPQQLDVSCLNVDPISPSLDPPPDGCSRALADRVALREAMLHGDEDQSLSPWEGWWFVSDSQMGAEVKAPVIKEEVRARLAAQREQVLWAEATEPTIDF